MSYLIRFFVFCAGALVSTQAFTAEIHDLAKAYEQAIYDSPKVAKLVCSQEVLSHIRWNNFYRPAEFYNQYQSFKLKREEYLGHLLDLGKMFDRNVNNESNFAVQVAREGYRDAVFDKAAYDSLADTFSLNMIQTLQLQSYYAYSLFNSESFKSVFRECIDFYGYNIEDIYNKVLNRVERNNHGGYIFGQGVTLLTGIGVFAKGASLLPKGGKVALYGVSAVAGGYFAYEFISPALAMIKKMEDIKDGEPITDSMGFTDRRLWADTFNEVVELKDLVVEFNNLETEVEKSTVQEKIDAEIIILNEKRDVLEFILSKYLNLKNVEGSELTQEQENDILLLEFSLILIQEFSLQETVQVQSQ